MKDMYDVFEADRAGMVLRLERSSVHDGEGLRTVVFLKGCPLCCSWCSTPESQSFKVETTDSNVYGSRMTVAEVMDEVRKDSLFYFLSHGGVTMSGGEVMAQPDFSYAILKNSQMEGFNTAIETSFFGAWENVKKVLSAVDTAFVDMKTFDEKLHKKYCGASNKLIKENLMKTNDISGNTRIVIRTPIIPGVNDNEEELTGIGQFCTRLKRLDHVQLLPYHSLGSATYAKLGRTYLMAGVEAPDEKAMERCREIVRKFVPNTI